MAKKAVGREVEAELVTDEDAQLVTTAGQSIAAFIAAIGPFFTKAKALEETAIELQATAQRLALPTTAEADEQVQRFIQRTSAAKREVEAHWSITATVSGFHRRMTARRARATDALEQANKVGNQLHNAYVEAERRRVREEQDRLDREAEARARLDRDQELARMEAEAVKREEASADLSGREQVFVEQVAQHGDGLRAAKAAGYRDPLASSARLLSAGKIQRAVQAARDAIAIRRQAAAVKQRPLEVDIPETVAPNVTRAPGAFDRTTHSAELVNETALIAACLAGTYGIPADILRVDPARLNEYARQLHERINLWPGVRYKKTTKVI